MTNAIIGWPSISSQFTLSGGSWESDYPITQLQSLPLSYVARTVDLDPANTVIIATSSTTRRVGIIGVPRHNISLAGTIRTRLYADEAMTTLIYDSGVVDVWPEVYPWPQLEWEDDNFWTGKYLESELAGTTWLWLWWVGTDYMAAGIRLDISDPTNTDGYIEAGYLEIAGQYQVTYNFQFGGQYGHRYRTTVTESLGGAKYFDERSKPRQIKATLLSPRDEALSKQFEIRRQQDLERPILWLPHPDETQHWVRTAMLAQIVDPGLITYRYLDTDEVPIFLEEVIG